MTNAHSGTAGSRQSAHRRLLVAYATVMAVVLAALWLGGAWIAKSLDLQAASQSSADATRLELASANEMLGYAVHIGSAQSDARPVQLVVALREAVDRCLDARREVTMAESGIHLDDGDRAELARLSVQVDAANGDMSIAAREVAAATQSDGSAGGTSLGATVTGLAAKEGTYADAARAEAAFLADLSTAALVTARTRFISTACAVAALIIIGLVGFIAPLHRRNANLIALTVRSKEQDARMSSDIARHIAERDRGEAEAQFRALFQQSSVGVILCGLDGRILDSNSALQRMLGFSADALQLMPYNALTPTSAYSPANEDVDGERLMRRNDGTDLWVEQTTTTAKASDDRTVAVVRMIQNIESRKTAEEQLRFEATHDALTGLYNRRYFDEAIDEAVRNPGFKRKPSFAVIMIDLDGFKYINDTRGHTVGDTVLAEVGRRLSRCGGQNVLVSRYGGDEFTAFLPGVSTVEPAVAIAQTVQRALREPMMIHGSRMLLSASIGISLWHPDFADGDAILQAADSAAYRAKSAGRGRSATYDASMAKDDRHRREIAANLRGALDDGELSIVFQPIVAIRERTCLGFEALVRWNHPQLGQISPAVFIPVAEKIGVVGEIGKLVLGQACRQLAIWRSQYRVDDLKINVNVSPQQMADPDFAETVAAALRDASLEPKHIGLELTETAIFESRGQGSETLEALRRIGTPIILDDFGTGFSSLTHLQKVPMVALKIDQSFVRGEDGDLASPPIVQTIIALANTLGIGIVAEGVETERQATLLAAMGCQAAQGYLYSAPLSAADATDFLLERSSGPSTIRALG